MFSLVNQPDQRIAQRLHKQLSYMRSMCVLIGQAINTESESPDIPAVSDVVACMTEMTTEILNTIESIS